MYAYNYPNPHRTIPPCLLKSALRSRICFYTANELAVTTSYNNAIPSMARPPKSYPAGYLIAPKDEDEKDRNTAMPAVSTSRLQELTLTCKV